MFEDAPNGQIPGGCEYCDAYQTAAQYAENVILIGIHHDDDCPFYMSGACPEWEAFIDRATGGRRRQFQLAVGRWIADEDDTDLRPMLNDMSTEDQQTAMSVLNKIAPAARAYLRKTTDHLAT